MRVVGHNFGNLIYIPHAVSALMKAEAPVRHHNGLSDNFRVLLSSFDRCWSRDEIEVEDATNGVILKVLPVRIVDLDIHSCNIVSALES